MQGFVLRSKCAQLQSLSVSDGRNLDFGIGCCFLSGMGGDRYLDDKRALQHVVRAASNGCNGAQAIVPRLAKVLKKTMTSNPLPMIEDCARKGSLAALEDLRALNPEKHRETQDYLRNVLSGVGAELYRYYLQPWRYVIVTDLAATQSVLQNGKISPVDSRVNIRGDRLLHAAANFGKTEIVQHLVEQHHVPINLQNEEGETALLCASRSGQSSTVRWLVDRGAMVSIFSSRKETPVHWLISFPDDEVDDMLQLFLRRGGQECLDVWADRCSYATTLISGYIDCWDNLCIGTPLHWAICRKRDDLVQLLLKCGTNPASFGSDPWNLTALELAAYLHEPQILRLIVAMAFPLDRIAYNDLGDRTIGVDKGVAKLTGSYVVGMSQMIEQAIFGCDRFKMIRRHGPEYEDKMNETFQILGKELAHVKLVKGINQLQTPIQCAVSTGHPEAVKMTIEHLRGASEVNIRWVGDDCTPIYDAVRRDNKGAFRLLVDNGAQLDTMINSPNRSGNHSWSLLHVAAQHVVDDDLELCRQILASGISVEGRANSTSNSESPLSIALEENQFALANLLRRRGANVDFVCRYIMYGRVHLKYPMSILGRIIAANLKFSSDRLQHLLWPGDEEEDFRQPRFSGGGQSSPYSPSRCMSRRRRDRSFQRW